MSPRNGGKVFGLLLAGGVAAALCATVMVPLLAGLAGPASAASAARALPAMTLTYRVESKRHGLDQPATVRVWQLAYQDERRWRKELVQSSDPREIGAVMGMQGTTYTQYSAVTRRTTTEELPQAPMAPEQWLIPDRERFLEGKGYRKAPDADGQLVRYTKTETHLCLAPSPPGEQPLTGVVQPAVCGIAPNFQATETIVYRTDLGVPTAVTMQVEGLTTQSVVVTQLTTP